MDSLLVIAPGLPFKLEFIELAGAEQDIEINGYTINVPRGGRFYPELAKENEVPLKLWSRLQKGETVEHEGKVFTPGMVTGPARKGIKVTYCTDTRPVPSLIKNAKDADLLICEGMYGEEGKVSKAVENKHIDRKSVV